MNLLQLFVCFIVTMTLSTAPVHNIFVALYLLNNSFHQNYLYTLDHPRDLETKNQEGAGFFYEINKKSQSETRPLKRKDEPPRTLIHSLKGYTQEFRQDETQRKRHNIKQRSSYIDNRKQIRKNPHWIPSETFDSSPDSEDMVHNNFVEDGIGLTNGTCYKNETIIHQKNIFILLPESFCECCPTVAAKKNYSNTLNNIAHNSKDAANKLTNMIKDKINKSGSVTNRVPFIHFNKNSSSIFQSIEINTTPYRKDEDNGSQSAASTVGVSTSQGYTISLLNNIKDMSDIIVKTATNQYAKLKTTTIKIQTQKIIIPSVGTFRNNDCNIKIDNFTKITLSKSENSDITNEIKGAKEYIRTKYNETKRTTCFTLYELADIKTMKSNKEIEISTEQIYKLTAPSMPKSSDANHSTNINSSHNKSSCPSLSVPYEIQSTTLLENIAQKMDSISKSPKAQSTTTFFEIPDNTKSICPSLNKSYEIQSTTLSEIMTQEMEPKLKKPTTQSTTTSIEDPENKINAKKKKSEKTDRDEKLNIPNKKQRQHPKEKLCNSTAVQKGPTQILKQNVFSPTMISGDKPRNQSVLVIKLVSEKPDALYESKLNHSELILDRLNKK